MSRKKLSSHDPARTLDLLGRGLCPTCETSLEGDYCPECDERYRIVGGGE